MVSYKLTFISPISKITENMERAQQRDAVLTQRLHFRSKLANCCMPHEIHEKTARTPELDTKEMTINEIVNGE